MYFRKIRPKTTCLYSAASMLLRSLSAASHSLASNPRLALPLVVVFLATLLHPYAFELMVMDRISRPNMGGVKRLFAELGRGKRNIEGSAATIHFRPSDNRPRDCSPVAAFTGI